MMLASRTSEGEALAGACVMARRVFARAEGAGAGTFFNGTELSVFSGALAGSENEPTTPGRGAARSGSGFGSA